MTTSPFHVSCGTQQDIYSSSIYIHTALKSLGVLFVFVFAHFLCKWTDFMCGLLLVSLAYEADQSLASEILVVLGPQVKDGIACNLDPPKPRIS
jgi:hypothetical protein